MRKTPIKIKLQCNAAANSLLFSVEKYEQHTYKWQKCNKGTATWIDVRTNHSNAYTLIVDSSVNAGDKYRCIISDYSDIVQYYTDVKTISIKDLENSRNYNYSRFSNDSYNRSYNNHHYGPSVADTDGMDGLEFEQYCAKLLLKLGYSDVQVTQGSGDFGIDVLAKKDSITYAIQCKCYTGPVSNKAVQEAYSGKSYYNCMVAVVLSNSYFTDAAIITAKRNSVLLWDRDVLDKMIKSAEETEKQKNNNNYQRSNNDNQSPEPDYFRGCATWDQVKSRYRNLMKTYHPDSGSGDEETSKIINNQYEELKRKFGV